MGRRVCMKIFSISFYLQGYGILAITEDIRTIIISRLPKTLNSPQALLIPGLAQAVIGRVLHQLSRAGCEIPNILLMVIRTCT